MAKVLIKKLASSVQLPTYKTSGASGMDLMAFIAEPIILKPQSSCLVPTGISVAFSEEFEIQIRPRSGLAAKNNISVLNNISEAIKEVENFSPKTKEEVEIFRLRFLAKSGVLNSFFNDFKNIPNKEKKEVGQMLNKLKALVKEKTISTLPSKKTEKKVGPEDFSRPVANNSIGSRHPLSIIEHEIVEIFSSIGFSISEGPEIEDDWHNFTALNVPKNHPARDMQDTFFIQTNPDILLRTHTSSVQARYMQKTPLQLGLFLLEEFIEMKLFLLELIAYFIK